ncbi:MAG: L-ribulose-5-phosphate 4-epimerase AraD [Tepidisphaera sp.]
MTALDRLCAEVCHANLALVNHGLVTLTWGNASAILRDEGLVAIKPSGVSYDTLTPDQIVVLELSGKVVRGALRPSTDAPTHLALYNAFPKVGAIVHTHSTFATVFAQARREIPCLGTTHADHFAGAVPVTRQLTPAELTEYEHNTGRVIVERFANTDPAAIPAVLVAGHAPFAWGPSMAKAVDNAVALEAVARMAHATLLFRPDTPTLEPHVLAKHHDRKHGANRYYGQP